MPMDANTSLLSDFCQLLSATMSYLLDRSLFCLTAFLGALSSFQNVDWGVRQLASQEYMLGLGEFNYHTKTNSRQLFMVFPRYR